MSEKHFFGVAQGVHPGVSHINKFGYNTSVGTSYEVICDLGTHHYPTSAAVASIVSSDAADSSAGTGARTVEVQGLDGDYAEVTETVTMNGTAAVSTTNSFIRIFRVRVKTAGTSETNVGNITLTIGSNIARITAGQGQTLMAVYTVPANKTAFLLKFQGSLSKNQEANFQLRARDFNNGWNVKGLWGTFAEGVTYDYPVPLKFLEKTDIEIRGKAGATSEMGAIFDLVLVDNPV